MPGKDHKKEDFNPNWEAEISDYDEQCKTLDREYYAHHLVVNSKIREALKDEERLILDLFLSGMSCEEIAKQNQVMVEVVTGLLEIIQAKLSIEN